MKKILTVLLLIISGYVIGYQYGKVENKEPAPTIVKQILNDKDLDMQTVSYMCKFLESKGMLDEYRRIKPLDFN